MALTVGFPGIYTVKNQPENLNLLAVKLYKIQPVIMANFEKR